MAKTKGKRGRPKKEAGAPVKPHGKKGRPALPKSERIDYKLGDMLKIEFAGSVEVGRLESIEIPKWGDSSEPFYTVFDGKFNYPVLYGQILEKL